MHHPEDVARAYQPVQQLINSFEPKKLSWLRVVEKNR